MGYPSGRAGPSEISTCSDVQVSPYSLAIGIAETRIHLRASSSSPSTPTSSLRQPPVAATETAAAQGLTHVSLYTARLCHAVQDNVGYEWRSYRVHRLYNVLYCGRRRRRQSLEEEQREAGQQQAQVATAAAADGIYEEIDMKWTATRCRITRSRLGLRLATMISWAARLLSDRISPRQSTTITSRPLPTSEL